MANSFERYYKKQMRNPEMRQLVEQELASLDIGVKIAQLREKAKMNQTELAAKSGMNASKISQIETAPRNLTLNTLARVACALQATMKIEFVPAKPRQKTRRNTTQRQAGRRVAQG